MSVCNVRNYVYQLNQNSQFNSRSWISTDSWGSWEWKMQTILSFYLCHYPLRTVNRGFQKQSPLFIWLTNNILSLAKEQWKGVRRGFSDLVWSNFLVTWRIIFLRHHTQATINNSFNTFSKLSLLMYSSKNDLFECVYARGEIFLDQHNCTEEWRVDFNVYCSEKRFYFLFRNFSAVAWFQSENWIVTSDVHSTGRSQRSNNRLLYKKLSWQYWMLYINGSEESFG